ncbi:cytochrome P450 (plasmid) [Sphingopyxis granuli]|nr:cytochrome P450 [Sphingopyxis granuli]
MDAAIEAERAGFFVSDIDIYSEEVLRDPYPVYASFREAGGAVFLARHNVYAFARFDQVRNALADWETYASSDGITLNPAFNRMVSNSTLFSDPLHHTHLRKVLGRPLTPAALAKLRDQVTAEAEALVAKLMARKRFDAVTDLAQYLPLTIVSKLVGMPDEGRERMLEWAFATFDAFGPPSQRTNGTLEIIEQMFVFAREYLRKDLVRPGSWHAMIFEAAERGEITEDECKGLLGDYIVPSLDTTISATSNAVWQFANAPDQWTALRNDPKLIPNAINEVIRIEAPVQGFARVTTKACAVDGRPIPQGARVIMLFASANRDELRWPDADRFDVTRPAADQLGFGHGHHRCVGANLARLEISALFTAMLPHVERFVLHNSERAINSMIRGWKSLDVEVR